MSQDDLNREIPLSDLSLAQQTAQISELRFFHEEFRVFKPEVGRSQEWETWFGEEWYMRVVMLTAFPAANIIHHIPFRKHSNQIQSENHIVFHRTQLTANMSNSQDASHSGCQTANSALLSPCLKSPIVSPGLWSAAATAGSMSPQRSTCGTSNPQVTPTRVHQHPVHEHPVRQNHPGSSERHMVVQYIQHYHAKDGETPFIAKIDHVAPARKDPGGCGSYGQAAGVGSAQK